MQVLFQQQGSNDYFLSQCFIAEKANDQLSSFMKHELNDEFSCFKKMK